MLDNILLLSLPFFGQPWSLVKPQCFEWMLIGHPAWSHPGLQHQPPRCLVYQPTVSKPPLSHLSSSAPPMVISSLRHVLIVTESAQVEYGSLKESWMKLYKQLRGIYLTTQVENSNSQMVPMVALWKAQQETISNKAGLPKEMVKTSLFDFAVRDATFRTCPPFTKPNLPTGLGHHTPTASGL